MRTLTRQKLQGLRAARSPSRRRRFNPEMMAPAGVPAAKWKDQVDRSKSELRSALLMFRRQLVEAGVPEDVLPAGDAINAHAKEAGIVLASSQYADLAEQSRLLTPSAEVAQDVLGLSSGGIFERASNEAKAKSLVKTARNAMVSRLDGLREAALRKREEVRVDIRAAEKERLEEEAELLRAQIAAEEAGVELTDADKEALAAEIAEGAGEVVEEVVEAPKRGRSQQGRRRSATKVREEVEAVFDAPLQESERVVSESSKGARLGAFVDRLVRVRVRAGAPFEGNPQLQAETAKDIVLYKLNDGTTQVWIKGALTESFTHSRGKASYTVAKQYAVDWLARKNIRNEVRKSHRDMRIVFTTQEEPDRMKVILESVASRSAPAEKGASFDAMVEELMGKKANPRRERPFRNPESEAIANQLKASLRRTNGFGTILAGVGGFVAGTYAEASFGLSKHFTRGGKAAFRAGKEGVRAARERRLPELPKAKKPARFEPSDRLVKMYRAFDLAEEKKKRIPFAEAERRAAAEDQLDAMWAQIEATRAQEEAAWKAKKSNPVQIYETLSRAEKQALLGDRLKVALVELAKAQEMRDIYAKLRGQNPYFDEQYDYYVDRVAGEKLKIEELKREMVRLSQKRNPGLSLAQGNQPPMQMSPIGGPPRFNGRKLPVPEHIAKTPRKAGERISAIGVKGKWPIGDLFHARLAAIYIMSPSHRAKKAQVLRALETNWPQYDWRAFIGEKSMRLVANPSDYEKALQLSDLRDMKRYGVITTGEYNDGLQYIEEGRGEEYLSYLRRRIAG